MHQNAIQSKVIVKNITVISLTNKIFKFTAFTALASTAKVQKVTIINQIRKHFS